MVRVSNTIFVFKLNFHEKHMTLSIHCAFRKSTNMTRVILHYSLLSLAQGHFTKGQSEVGELLTG